MFGRIHAHWRAQRVLARIVDVCVAFDEIAGDVNVVVVAGFVQRCPASIVLGVDIRPRPY